MLILSKGALMLTALTALGLTAAHRTLAQGINGQQVQLLYRYPDTSTTFEDIGTQTVTNAGVTFVDDQGGAFPFMTINITPSKMEFTPIGDIAFAEVGFTGYELSQAGLVPASITGVTVDPATSIFGTLTGPETFDASRVTFDSTNVFVNFQGLELSPTSSVTLDLIASPAAVPEASTTVSLGLLLAFGLGGMVIAKRKKTSAA